MDTRLLIRQIDAEITKLQQAREASAALGFSNTSQKRRNVHREHLLASMSQVESAVLYRPRLKPKSLLRKGNLGGSKFGKVYADRIAHDDLD